MNSASAVDRVEALLVLASQLMGASPSNTIRPARSSAVESCPEEPPQGPVCVALGQKKSGRHMCAEKWARFRHNPSFKLPAMSQGH